MKMSVQDITKKLKNVFKSTGLSVLKITPRQWRLIFEINLTDNMVAARAKEGERYDAIRDILSEDSIRKYLDDDGLCGDLDPDMWLGLIHPEYDIADRHVFVAVTIEKQEATISGIVITGAYQKSFHDHTHVQHEDGVMEIQLVCGGNSGRGIGRLLLAYAVVWNASRKVKRTYRYTGLWAEMTVDLNDNRPSHKLLTSIGMKPEKRHNRIVAARRNFVTGDMLPAITAINDFEYSMYGQDYEDICPSTGRGQCF